MIQTIVIKVMLFAVTKMHIMESIKHINSKTIKTKKCQKTTFNYKQIKIFKKLLSQHHVSPEIWTKLDNNP